MVCGPIAIKYTNSVTFFIIQGPDIPRHLDVYREIVPDRTQVGSKKMHYSPPGLREPKVSRAGKSLDLVPEGDVLECFT